MDHHPSTRQCAGCPCVFVAKRRDHDWCSRKCRLRARDKTRARPDRAERLRQMVSFVCSCGSTVTMQRRGAYLAKGRCAPCRAAERARLRPPRPAYPATKIRFAECTWCDHLFVLRPGRSRRRCESCGRCKAGAASRIEILGCRECGGAFVSRSRQAFCSAGCSRKSFNRSKRHRERASGRRGGSVRRPVESESFTLREIAERDGWRCHLCRRSVPDREYKARPLDPTLDHLVPIADGGAHSRANVALAHNRCNWQRAAGGIAQLRLVG